MPMQNRETLLKELPQLLLPWYRQNKRDLPWRKNKNPYRILVSEVMLQQTRVEAVIHKYNNFMEKLPTIEDLANCPEQELLKLWEGLGYYSRAKNLQKTAQEIVQNGFAREAKELIKLKGVGSYTAGAIASIAFEEKAPAVDGNVIRVLSRYLHDALPQDLLREQYFIELQPIYPTGNCGDFTQSLMELGATICTPKSPSCLACPLLANCQTRDASLPLKKEKVIQKEEEYILLLFHDRNDIALIQRQTGVLKNLFGFYMLENKLLQKKISNTAIHNRISQLDNVLQENEVDRRKHRQPSKTDIEKYLQEFALNNYIIDDVKTHKHIFTHIIWHMFAYPIYLPNCKNQLKNLPDFQELQFFDKPFIQENISLPSAFRWCLKYI